MITMHPKQRHIACSRAISRTDPAQRTCVATLPPPQILLHLLRCHIRRTTNCRTRVLRLKIAYAIKSLAPVPTFGLRPEEKRPKLCTAIAWPYGAGSPDGRSVFRPLQTSGGNSHDHADADPPTGGRNDERRTASHLCFLARYRVRMVRLLSLRHAGALLRRAVLSARQ